MTTGIRNRFASIVGELDLKPPPGSTPNGGIYDFSVISYGKTAAIYFQSNSQVTTCLANI